MKKILVLGAGGMAGHVIALSLRKAGFSVDTLSARNALDKNTVLMDVLDQENLKEILNAKNYDAVINCIGMLVKQSEDRKDLAVYLNTYLPHFLENHFAKSKTKVIHLSTDCVFSGNNAPYDEHSHHDGELFYDRSKSLGEIVNEKDLTFRMSIVGPDMQPDGIGLFNWFIQQEGTVTGFKNAIWSGITTIELAKGICAAIDQNLCGVYNLVPSTNISKFELLKIFGDVFNSNITIEPDDRPAPDKTLINTRTDFDYSVPDYKTMIHEMKHWINDHADIYPYKFDGEA